MGRQVLQRLRAQPSHHYGILRDWNLALLRKGGGLPDDTVERLKSASDRVSDTAVSGESSLAPSLSLVAPVLKRTRLLELASRDGGVTFAELQKDPVMDWSQKEDVSGAVKSLRRHLNHHFKSLHREDKIKIEDDRVWLEKPPQK
jgi:hypothetical protein